MSGQLSAAQRNAVSRISGLVVINAMIFQEILAEHDPRVLPLQKMLAKGTLVRQFGEHWQFILDDIDYYPIFHVACQILGDLTATQGMIEALKDLAATAQSIVGMRAALRHDLMGRIYHRLLVEAKYLGTYYTGIPAATLLLKLALRPDAWDVEWRDLEQLRHLRVADLACGTGTLLMAAADSVTDNYISESAAQGQEIDVVALHTTLVEEVLHGYDVLPSAIHLTASTLALRAPHIAFTKMNLFSLPLGGPHRRLGSIEYLQSKYLQLQMDLFAAAPATRQVRGDEAVEMPSAPLPDLDLCVMNPPFTRSVGGNLLFGSVPENERTQMQTKLRRLVRVSKASASITAGLGSVFVATAHRHTKPGGRMALVLPKTVLSGVAWKKTRRLLREKYRLDYIIASQHPERWNFSENTSLSEVLLVASKVDDDTARRSEPPCVVGVNLWRNPVTAFEALSVAHRLSSNRVPDIRHGQGALELFVGEQKVGEAIAYPWDELKSHDGWMLPCSYAQSDLIRAAFHLLQGSLWLPGHGKVAQIQLSALREFGSLGPDRRDVSDGFNRSATPTAYAGFWGHSAKTVCTLAQEPNCHLSPLSRAKKGRPLRNIEDLWPLAGRLLVAEGLRLNTQSLVSVRLPGAVLSNVWWPFALSRGFRTDDHEKAVVLWLNSTLGLLSLLARRQETEGAWVGFKKPVLAGLPVVDLRALSRGELQGLGSAYDKVCDRQLGPFPEMAVDPVRAEIDGSIARILGLPDFSTLREMLSREPVVCSKQL